MEPRGRLEVRAFTDDVIDDAAPLLASRHRQQRTAEPGLSPVYEDVAAARTEIATLAAKEGASGAVAIRGGQVVGYLVGAPRAPSWGPNVWVEGSGHAVAEPEVARDLYGFAAARWVDEGATSHYAVVPATDAALVDAWFRSGFGQQHVHAIRAAAAPGETLRPRDGLVIRRAERRDISMLGRLEVVLGEHQVLSPVFSRVGPPTLEDATNEWEEGFDDPQFTTFVAEHDGLVIGSAVCCAIEESSEHQGIVRPANAGFLGFAAVIPRRAVWASAERWARPYCRGRAMPATRPWSPTGVRPTCCRAAPGRASASARRSGGSSARSPDPGRAA